MSYNTHLRYIVCDRVRSLYSLSHDMLGLEQSSQLQVIRFHEDHPPDLSREVRGCREGLY